MSLKPITIFPGTKLEYEEFVGYKVEIINTDSPNKGVHIIETGNPSISSSKLKNIEAIVNAIIKSPSKMSGVDLIPGIYYGLPVKKKQTNEAAQ